jgi:hypothetical protein
MLTCDVYLRAEQVIKGNSKVSHAYNKDYPASMRQDTIKFVNGEP